MEFDVNSIWLQIGATVTTLASTWWMAHRHLAAPVLGIVSDIFWLTLDVHLGLWFIVPVPIVMMALHVRVYRRWSRS